MKKSFHRRYPTVLLFAALLVTTKCMSKVHTTGVGRSYPVISATAQTTRPVVTVVGVTAAVVNALVSPIFITK